MAHVIEPPSGHKKVKCQECFAKIGYTPGEVKSVNGRDYGGGSDGHEFIVCPNCGKKIILRTW